jgi:hypothetical protein
VSERPKIRKLALQPESITIAEREVGVYEAPVLAISIAQKNRRRQVLAKGLLRDDAVLLKWIFIAGREAVAITSAEDEALCGVVIEVSA